MLQGFSQRVQYSFGNQQQGGEPLQATVTSNQYDQHDQQEGEWGLGHRMYEDRFADRPLGGEVEAGYGIGNRMLDDRHAHQPLGGEIEAGYGIGNRMLEHPSAAASGQPRAPVREAWGEPQPASTTNKVLTLTLTLTPACLHHQQGALPPQPASSSMFLPMNLLWVVRSCRVLHNFVSPGVPTRVLLSAGIPGDGLWCKPACGGVA